MQNSELKNIFGDPLGGGHLEITEKAVIDFPYFSLAHLTLLKATDSGHPEYNRRLAKAGLHFNNPFLLRFFLTQNFGAIANKDSEVSMATPGIPLHSNVHMNENDRLIPENEIFEISHPSELEHKTPDETQNNVVEEKVAETKVENAPLIFEPLYTTDYFASQGIKLSEEIKPDDKLGKQLRSFTDWLKTMKKVHEQRLPAGNEQMDVAVVTLAEKSNKEDDVLTESMAEAYLSQGKTRKAIEIYDKLSLLNPAKSTYFAAKIASLKDR